MKDSRGSHMLCQTGAYCTELTLRDQCMCAWFHKRSDTRNDREMDDWMFVHVCRARGYCKSSVLNKNTRQCPRPGLKPGLLYSVDKCTHHEATTTPYRDLFNCFIIVTSQFPAKIQYFWLRNFHFLLYPGIQWCYENLLSNFHFQAVTHERLITKENFKVLALKVAAATYKRSLLTKGSKYDDLWPLVPLENRSLRRSGHNQKFNCTVVCICNWICFAGEKQYDINAYSHLVNILTVVWCIRIYKLGIQYMVNNNT